MNLAKKKALAARTLEVGKGRIIFVNARLNEIKEAITKQDIRDLNKEGAILIKGIKGRKRNINKKKKRSVGNVRKKVNKRKQEYVKLTRKLRKYVATVMKDKKEIKEIRKKIRNKSFRSLAHLKELIGGVKNENTKTKKKRK